MKREEIRGEIFWSFVDIQGPDDCWEWLGCKNSQGYGRFRVVGCTRQAHQISWVISNGEIPNLFEGFPSQICHKCDNLSCINPNHLFLGNAKLNKKDSASKGRNFKPKGSANGRAKLIESEVNVIKLWLEEGVLIQGQIAKRYGISDMTVSRINTGLCWSCFN